MNSSVKSLFLLLLVFAGFLSCVAQTEGGAELYIGTSALRIGSPQRAVMAEISRKYRAVEDDGLFQVWDGSGSNSTIIGTLGFKDGKLSFIAATQYVGIAGDPRFPHALFEVARGFVQDGNTLCALSANSTKSSEGGGEAIFLICGQRTIKVTTVTLPTSREIVSIEEQLGAK